MKRIAFISHLSEVSGATIALLETAVGFSEHGYGTVLVLPGNGPIADRAADRGIRTIILKNPETGLGDASLSEKLALVMARIGFVRRLRSFLRQEKIDIAYVNSSTTIFPGIAARAAGVPIVWHIHESLTRDDFVARKKKWLIRKLADGLLFASESGRQHLSPDERPSLIVRNKVSMEELQRVRRSRQQSDGNGGTGESAVALLANGVYRLKGADILLAAAALLEDQFAGIRIVVVGSVDAEPHFYKQLNDRADGLATDVEFPGMQRSLAPLFEKASLFISASRNEAMPIAIVEAMAAGVPVIATAVGDCAELLENGRCGWIVPPEDPEALAVAINEALENPGVAAVRAAAAAEKVDRLYGGDDFWQPLMTFVEKVAAKQ